MRVCVAAVLLVASAACASERPAPGTMAADSATVMTTGDSTIQKPIDSLTPRADSVMVRDTAKGL